MGNHGMIWHHLRNRLNIMGPAKTFIYNLQLQVDQTGGTIVSIIYSTYYDLQKHANTCTHSHTFRPCLHQISQPLCPAPSLVVSYVQVICHCHESRVMIHLSQGACNNLSFHSIGFHSIRLWSWQNMAAMDMVSL